MAVINKSPYYEMIGVIEADAIQPGHEIVGALNEALDAPVRDIFTGLSHTYPVMTDYYDENTSYNFFNTQGKIVCNNLFYDDASGAGEYTFRYSVPGQGPSSWDDVYLTIKGTDSNGDFFPFSPVESSLIRTGAYVATTTIWGTEQASHSAYVPVFDGSADLQPVAYSRTYGDYYYWNNSNHEWVQIGAPK